MSRCFPFPPPGYEKKNNKVSDEALIESIKRERDTAEKERRKEKKREEKEKKKKEKKGKSGLNGEIEKIRHSHKDEKKERKKKEAEVNGEVEKKRRKHKDEGASANHKFFDYQKKKESETEQLEKSGLTEEHGHAASVPTLCDSSDSTQNSGKRKRPNMPSEGTRNQSTILRIRLPLIKQRDAAEPLSKEQSCSLLVGTEVTAQKMADIAPLNVTESCSISGRTEVEVKDSTEPASAAAKLSLGKSGSLSDMELRYLIENWLPPPIQFEQNDSDDQDWLFDMPSKCHSKKLKVSEVAPCYTPSLWPPRACYLPEAEMYALPFTVPF